MFNIMDHMETAQKTEAPDLEAEEIQLPAVIEANEQKVRTGFWTKFTRVAASIPFSGDLLAAYYCARDPETPTRVRAILLAALAYFVLPTDMIPDFIVGLGFSDDAAVLMAAVGLISAHLKPQHRQEAETTLNSLRAGEMVPDPGDTSEKPHG